MTDERDGSGAAGDGGTPDDESASGGRTAVATRTLRPTGKRSRSAGTTPVEPAADGDAPAAETDGGDDLDGSGPKSEKKTDRKQSGPSRNPLRFVLTYLQQVVGELRKVIWPNRKQMVSYTTVVLVFLAFMVALISGVDLGLAKLIALVFGD